MDKIVFLTLNKIGVPCHLKGRKYIEFAVEKILEDQFYVHDLMKCLYYETAKEFNTSVTNVERGIRNAIICTFNEVNWSELNDIFGNCISKRTGMPDNKRFLAGVAEYIRHIDV